MPIFNNQLAGAAGQGGADAAYQIDRSLRFNSADSAYLNRTPSSAGNRKTWTWSGWVKRTALGVRTPIFTGDNAIGGGDSFEFTSDDALRIYWNGAINGDAISDAVFRDPSAWYHFVFSIDLNQTTASDRVKIYVNGTLQTLSAGPFGGTYGTYPASTYNTEINTATPQWLGRLGSSTYSSFYLADVHFIDGQALDPTDFGAFDADGVWAPKEYAGTYGTNGFHLDFSDNSSAAALGTDTSGNSNTWTVNNISVEAGNGSYISSVSNTGTIYTGSVADLFDGSTSNLDTLRMYGGTWTFTPATTVTVNTSVRVLAFNDGVGRTNTLTANGTSVSVTDQTLTWRTITLPSYPVTLTSLSATAGGSSSVDGICVAAIEIDGVILVDYRFGSGNDSLVDTPTNYEASSGNNNGGNYCTWNALALGADATLSDGNLKIAYGSSGTRSSTIGTFGMSSGKWYWETEITASSLTNASAVVGISLTSSSSSLYPGYNALEWGYYGTTGAKTHNNINTSYGDVYGVGDVIGVAFDADNGDLYFYKNGTVQNSGTAAYTGLTSGPYFPAIGDGSATNTFTAVSNFGQRPFAYTPPTGYKSLCTTNLTDPTIADGSTAFDAVLYTGNGSTQSITGLGFSPDFVWTKQRNTARNHGLYDIVRGATKRLTSNGTNAEITDANLLTSFDSNGFSVGNDSEVNESSGTYVGWAWDGGTTTDTSNTAGSITPTGVRANQSAGFSIVTFTMGSGTFTVGHGLNAAPALLITKGRSFTSNWWVYHQSLGSSQYLGLNSTSAANSLSWGGSPTSTVFTANNNFFANGQNYVVYAFAPVAGYSSFGSYSASSAPNFIYTGFTPALVICKRTDTAGEGWLMTTWKTQGYNSFGAYLGAHSSAAELTTPNYMDVVSNGFVHRHNLGWNNASGGTYIYAAFAEHPFKTARAR